MFELRFPTKIIFGQNTFEQIGKESREFGDRAFIATGGTSMKKAGVVDKTNELLKSAGFEEIFWYDRVEHDPSTKTVDIGTEEARRFQARVVIGIGGGSALDTAKAIACMFKNEGSVEEYQFGREIRNPGIPFIAVPTTAGTGAEITKNAVLTNKEKKIKESIRSPYMIAKVAIVDPLLTATMPPDVTGATGMDALTQSIEAYITRASNPITDTLAIRSISLISSNLLLAFRNGSDIIARENVALGSLLGAMAFANSGLGAVHGLAHPIGAMFDAPHGAICALLLPYVMEYNLQAKITKFAQIAEAMGQDIKSAKSQEDAAFMAIKAVKELISNLNLPQHLSYFGISKDDLQIIAEATRGSSLNNNPVVATALELQKILLKAL